MKTIKKLVTNLQARLSQAELSIAEKPTGSLGSNSEFVAIINDLSKRIKEFYSEWRNKLSCLLVTNEKVNL